MNDLAGKKYGRLLVLYKSGHDKNKKIAWYCECECGTYVIVPSNSLRTGNTKSCGCLKKESCSKNGKKSKHGLSKTPEYDTWNSIRRRCSPNNRDSKFYYDRGIRMSDEWMGVDGLKRFINHIGKRPSNKHSIGRIDNNKGYEPGNVRWAEWSTQVKNKNKFGSLKSFSNQELLDELNKRGIIIPDPSN